MNSQNVQHCQTKTDEKNDLVFRTLSDSSNRTENIVAGLMEKAIVAPNPITGIGSPWCSRPATPEEKQTFRDMCRKMALKFLWLLWNSERIRGKGNGWVPTLSCVDLTTTGAALTADETAMSVEEVRELWAFDPGTVRRKSSHKTVRHFKKCRQCGKKFLAKRANQEFDAKKCGLRWNRAHAGAGMMLETAQVPPQAA
jgi:hypothetical protein